MGHLLGAGGIDSLTEKIIIDKASVGMKNSMKKIKIVPLKFLSIAIMAFLTIGCVNIIHQYSPQKAINWKKDYSDHYKYQCNGAEIGVFPLQTKPTYRGKPWMSVSVHNPKGHQEACKVSSLWLENTETGQRMNPIKVEVPYSRDKTRMHCYYFFDMPENNEVRYSLHISDKLLGCSIDPIPYIFEKTWEVQPQDVM